MTMATNRLKAAMALAISVLLAPPALAQMGPMPVEVAKPLVAEVTDWDEYTGRFEATQRVELRARVSGYLQEVLFRDGQMVEKDQVLFRIDRRPFEAAFAQAVAEFQAAGAEQSRARDALERNKRLEARGAVSTSALDDAIAAKLTADASVAMAEAAMRNASLNLEYTEIKAPFAGRISDSFVDVGNLVGEGDTLLATVVAVNPIYLVFSASEADFLKYARRVAESRRNQQTADVEAKLLDEEGWTHKGQMDFVGNEIDTGSGTLKSRAVFDNSDDLLLPGLFARLRVAASIDQQALLIPDAAVLSDQARKIVYTVDGEGAVSVKVVTLGQLDQGLRVIKSGLSPDDRVIVNGLLRARPGGKVIVEETQIALPASGAAQ